MDFLEKARIRLEHWISHSEHHREEYEMFAEQLEESGKEKSARSIREMIDLESRSTDCLQAALKNLDT
jgi:rubrerythrin